jgi:hypothetical protein
MNVIIRLRAKFIFDLALRTSWHFFTTAPSTGGIVEIEVDLGVLRHAEFIEQVVKNGAAVRIEDLALDGTDAQMLQRGIVLAGHFRQAELHVCWMPSSWLSEPKARRFWISSARMVSSRATCGTMNERALRLFVVFCCRRGTARSSFQSD